MSQQDPWRAFRLAHPELYSEEFKQSGYWPDKAPVAPAPRQSMAWANKYFQRLVLE